MISTAILDLPCANPEVYLNVMRVVASKEFGSWRPIAFRSCEGDSTVVNVDSAAYTTPDEFIVALTDAVYAGAPQDGVVTATLTNKSEYTLKDLEFSGSVSVEGDSAILKLESKSDFDVYFRWGKGIHTAQENSEFLAAYTATTTRKGIVYFTSNHTVVRNMMYQKVDNGYEVTLDAKDNTCVQDVLQRMKEVINQINVEV